MNILITTGIFPPEVGGPATFAAEFSKRMAALGHSITVLAYSDSKAFPADDALSFRLIRVTRSSNKISNYLRFFWAALKAGKGKDFIYTLDWFSAGVPVMAAAFLLRKGYIVRVGGGYIWEKYLSEGREPVSLQDFYDRDIYKEYRLMYLLITLVLKRAAKVIFNSRRQKSLYEKYYGLVPEKACVIQNAVSSHAAVSLIQNFNAKNREKDKEIVFAGRFIKMKNVESLIRAFARLADPSFRLVLIGDGPTESLLHDLVRRLRIENRVEFLPKLAQADLYRRISNCYLFVLPSWTDVSPHQVYECLALGIPVLLTKENYLDLHIDPEYLIDPHSVDDIADKMNNLLDQKEYKKFAKALSEIRVERSWEDVVADHQSVFHRFA